MVITLAQPVELVCSILAGDLNGYNLPQTVAERDGGTANVGLNQIPLAVTIQIVKYITADDAVIPETTK